MKNESKKIEEKTYTTGEVGSMIERFDDSLKIVAENIIGVNDRLGRVETRLESFDNRLGRVEIKLDAVEVRLDSVETKLELVETKIDRLQDDMVEVKFELKRKVDAEDVKNLEKRVVKLENLSLAN